MKRATLEQPITLAGVKLSQESSERLRATFLPQWVTPELATLTHQYFWNDQWAYEEKLDGERLLARRGETIELFTRNGQHLNATYPEVVEALSAVPGRWWLDGEVVALDHRGVSSFKELQKRLQVKNATLARGSGVAVYYYVFDVMYLDGYDTRGLPYGDRRTIVQSLVQPSEVLRHVRSEPPSARAFDAICRRGWEGFVVKDLTSSYRASRTRDWLKFKCNNEQELVIIGFTDPKGSRAGFGALLLGYHDTGRMIYAGKVGTGFDTETLLRLRQQMREFETNEKPVVEHVPEKGIHWLRPKLVAQVGFTEWTTDNKLRHPRFLGLRTDKASQDVIKEQP